MALRENMKKRKLIPSIYKQHAEGSAITPKRHRSILHRDDSPLEKEEDTGSILGVHRINRAVIKKQQVLESNLISTSDNIPLKILMHALMYMDVCDVVSICVVFRRWLKAFRLVETYLWKSFVNKHHPSNYRIINYPENDEQNTQTCCHGEPRDEASWWMEQFKKRHLVLRCAKTEQVTNIQWSSPTILKTDAAIRPISSYMFLLDFICKSGEASVERNTCRHITKLAENIDGPDNDGAFEIELLDVIDEFHSARNIHGYRVNEVCIHIVHQATGKSSIFYRGEVSDDHYPGYLVYSYFPSEDNNDEIQHCGNNEDRSPLISACIKSHWEDCQCQCRCSSLGNCLCSSDCCRCSCEKWGGEYKHERSIEIQMLWDNGEHMDCDEIRSLLNCIRFD